MALNLLKWLARFVTFFVLLVLALNNQQVVPLHGIGAATWSIPMAWLLLITLALGACIGALALMPTLFKQRRAIRSAQKSATPLPIPARPDDELGI